MKIAIPADEKNINTVVCPSFGRAPFYMVYDTATKDTSFLVNDAAQSAGGAGIKAAQLLVDSGVEVVITPRYGENAAKVLIDAGVKAYKNIAGSAAENVTAYEKGQLALLEDFHPGFHNHGTK